MLTQEPKMTFRICILFERYNLPLTIALNVFRFFWIFISFLKNAQRLLKKSKFQHGNLNILGAEGVNFANWKYKTKKEKLKIKKNLKKKLKNWREKIPLICTKRECLPMTQKWHPRSELFLRDTICFQLLRQIFSEFFEFLSYI